jgi:hypothetical protein
MNKSCDGVSTALFSEKRSLCGFVELMREMGLPGESQNVSVQALSVAPPSRRCGGASALLGATQRWAHGRMVAAPAACPAICHLMTRRPAR